MTKTKIFCDIADSKTIKEFNKKSIVDGFTTNPSLMRKAGAKSYEKYSKLLLKICRKKPISLEVRTYVAEEQGIVISTALLFRVNQSHPSIHPIPLIALSVPNCS